MARSCERPGCNRGAEVVFGFQAERLVVWLDNAAPDEIQRARSGALCRIHADSMVVPRGWTLDDRREAAPRLFRAGPEQPTGELPRPVRHRKRHPEDETGPMPTLFDEAAAIAETPGEPVGMEPPVDLDAEAGPTEDAAPWRPVFDSSDDLGGLLSADSPLLSRAFRGRAARPARPPAPDGEEG